MEERMKFQFVRASKPHLLGLMMMGLVMVFGTAFTAKADVSMKANISSVTIDPSTRTKINLTATSNLATAATDGKIYIFEIKPYQKDLSGRKDYLATQPAAANMTFSFALDSGPGEKRIYSSYVAAVKIGGGYTIVSNRCYVTNPEVVAPDQSAALNPGKKGLVIEPHLLDDAFSLNIKHAAYNISTENFFGSGIWYSFEGKSYQINAALINELDVHVKALSDHGIAVTAILLNGWNSAVPELYRPGTTQLASSQAMYYAFNVETEQGFRAIKAMASFLAKRYNGSNGHGKITNWVIGNEINNQYWNYTGDLDVASYMRIFQRSFRVFYTAIKSESANDNVMFSIDQYWNMLPESGAVSKYKAKDVLEYFNAIGYEEGQFDWGLALHPYPYPLTSPNFWNDGASGKVTQDVSSPVVSFCNLHVITDFMQNAAILSPKGRVRHIFLTEEGFTSRSGSKDTSMEQAAAVAYSYYIVANNPYIEAYMMSRQADSGVEVSAGGLAFGLSSGYNGTGDTSTLAAKPAHEVFKNIDNPALSLAASEFAKPIIGITDWAQAIPGFQAPQ